MWLLDANSLELEEFYAEEAYKIDYAILSHTWLSRDRNKKVEEVLFHEMLDPGNRDAAKRKRGFRKIQKCCEQALADGFKWVWIDTCCIDKRSSAELSEAINSMFKWYAKAAICYVYLDDFSGIDAEEARLKLCRWFKRGWTLQQLLAPSKIKFFNIQWLLIPDLSYTPKDPKNGKALLSTLTGIEQRILEKTMNLSWCGVPERMTWAAERETSRPEDMAYCLLGIFGVNMPILYGEGGHEAFRRLQIEYMQRYFDNSLFVWCTSAAFSWTRPETIGLLAATPDDFTRTTFWRMDHSQVKVSRPWYMTSLGIAITLPMKVISDDVYLGVLECYSSHSHKAEPEALGVGIYLRPTVTSRTGP